ncbi:META domain-containing protein [Zavarzinia compransoris]|nr:META domain-containing protein [Zavarzinia marina]
MSALAALLPVLVLTAACAGPAALPEAGVDWTLAAMPGTELEGPAPTMTFAEEGRVHGSTGCNRFTGTAEATADGLSFGPLAATRMACIGPTVETEYLARLERVAGWRIDGESLVFTDGAGAVLMVYDR